VSKSTNCWRALNASWGKDKRGNGTSKRKRVGGRASAAWTSGESAHEKVEKKEEKKKGGGHSSYRPAQVGRIDREEKYLYKSSEENGGGEGWCKECNLLHDVHQKLLLRLERSSRNSPSLEMEFRQGYPSTHEAESPSGKGTSSINTAELICRVSTWSNLHTENHCSSSQIPVTTRFLKKRSTVPSPGARKVADQEHKNSGIRVNQKETKSRWLERDVAHGTAGVFSKNYIYERLGGACPLARGGNMKPQARRKAETEGARRWTRRLLQVPAVPGAAATGRLGLKEGSASV